MNNRYVFKAKHIHDLQENKHLDGVWVTGYLSSENYITNNDGEFLIDPSTICQYTGSGQCTLNEKPIYENDIVTNGYYIGIVRFGLYDTTHFGFYIEWIKHGVLRKDIMYWISKIKTIGNIFDNPELLGQEG